MIKKNILTGIAASPGIVKGIVRVVLSDDDIKNFPENAVLVTEITNPSMVMIMARSAAIVTNKGGITSHPAIVSRELGIACVVSTKTATENLSNGDLVEVDGSKGKVKLISKK